VLTLTEKKGRKPWSSLTRLSTSPDSQGKGEDCHANKAPLQKIRHLKVGNAVWACCGEDWLRGTVETIGRSNRNAKISTGEGKVTICDPDLAKWRKECL